MIDDFISRVRSIERQFKSIRITTLLADRGTGSLLPVITRIHLLSNLPSDVHDVQWKSDTIQVSSRTMTYSTIENLVGAMTSGNLELESIHVGFAETEEASWSYEVVRQSTENDFGSPSNALVLEGKLSLSREVDANHPRFRNATMLNPEMTFTSIQELTQILLGRGYNNLNEKRVEVIAPFNTRIEHLHCHGDKVVVGIRCTSDFIGQLKLKAGFHLASGGVTKHALRLHWNRIEVTQLDSGMVEFSKSFSIPHAIENVVGVKVTVSSEGTTGIALDSSYDSNWPVMNKIRSSFDLLDQRKVGRFFASTGFENVYASLGGGNDEQKLESVICSLLASCGLDVIWLGCFDLSCEDILAFVPGSRKVLVVEVTTGAPERKIGLMKTVLRSLRLSASWLDFKGIVITSNYVSQSDRNNASASGVVLLDVTDLKALLQLAGEAPNPLNAMHLLGVA